MDPQLRGSGFAAVSAIPGFFGILSPFLGGYLMTFFGVEKGMRVLYAITIIGMLLITLMNWRFLNETLTKEPCFREDLHHIVAGSYRNVWETLGWLPKNLRFYAAMIVITLFFNSLAGPFWVVYAKEILGFSELNWGRVLSLTSIIQFCLALPAGGLIDQYDKRKVVASALFLSVTPVIAFPFSGGFIRALMVLLPIAVSNAFLMPAAGALMTDMVPRERRGMVMATLGRGMLMTNIKGGGGGGPGMGFILCLPAMIGSLIGGYIYGINPSIPWILLGCALVVNSVLAAFLRTI
jgi:MFS family permease